MTVYVKRDQAGTILAISREGLSDEWEAVADDAPELAVFASGLAGGQKDLAATDLAVVRVLEDLIDLLIARDVIRFTDFPEAAQEKLLARRSLRSSLSSLNLLEEEGEGGVI